VSVAWSPDGRWLATASHDKTVHIYRPLGTIHSTEGGEGEGGGSRRSFTGLERVHTARFVVTPECLVFVPTSLTTSSSSSSNSNSSSDSDSNDSSGVVEWELVVALRDTAHLSYIDCTAPPAAAAAVAIDRSQNSVEKHVNNTAATVSTLPSFKARKVSLNEADWDTHVSFTPLCLSLSPDHKYLLIATDKGFHFVVRVGHSKRLRLLAGGHSCGNYGKPKVCIRMCIIFIIIFNIIIIIISSLFFSPRQYYHHVCRFAGILPATTFTATAMRVMQCVYMLLRVNVQYKSSLVYITVR
jgi:WD domain, G-beta repeat